MAKAKKKKIKFLLSPTGKYSLGYNVGDVTDSLSETVKDQLVEDKYAEFVK